MAKVLGRFNDKLDEMREMRAQGMTLKMIGKAVGGSVSTVWRRLERGKARQPYPFVVYPAVAEWMSESNIRYHDIADKAYFSPGYVGQMLRGNRPLAKEVADVICEMSGKTQGEMFGGRG